MLEAAIVHRPKLKVSSSAIKITGCPPVEIAMAFSNTCLPPCDAAQAFNISMEGKWISAI